MGAHVSPVHTASFALSPSLFFLFLFFSLLCAHYTGQFPEEKQMNAYKAVLWLFITKQGSFRLPVATSSNYIANHLNYKTSKFQCTCVVG